MKTSYDVGVDNFNSCDWSGSIRYFSDHLRKYPDDYNALIWRSKAYSFLGQTQIALRDTEHAIRVSSGVNREIAVARNIRASGDIEAYGCQAKRTVKKYPDDWKALMELGTFFTDVENHQKVTRCYTKSLSIAIKYNETSDPDICWLNYFVGNSLLKKKDVDTAKRYYEAAIDSCSTHTLSHIQQCRCNIAQGNISAAYKYFMKAKKFNQSLASETFQTKSFKEYVSRERPRAAPVSRVAAGIQGGGAEGGATGGSVEDNDNSNDYCDNKLKRAVMGLSSYQVPINTFILSKQHSIEKLVRQRAEDYLRRLEATSQQIYRFGELNLAGTKIFNVFVSRERPRYAVVSNSAPGIQGGGAEGRENKEGGEGELVIRADEIWNDNGYNVILDGFHRHFRFDIEPVQQILYDLSADGPSIQISVPSPPPALYTSSLQRANDRQAQVQALVNAMLSAIDLSSFRVHKTTSPRKMQDFIKMSSAEDSLKCLEATSHQNCCLVGLNQAGTKSFNVFVSRERPRYAVVLNSAAEIQGGGAEGGKEELVISAVEIWNDNGYNVMLDDFHRHIRFDIEPVPKILYDLSADDPTIQKSVPSPPFALSTSSPQRTIFTKAQLQAKVQALAIAMLSDIDRSSRPYSSDEFFVCKNSLRYPQATSHQNYCLVGQNLTLFTQPFLCLPP